MELLKNAMMCVREVSTSIFLAQFVSQVSEQIFFICENGLMGLRVSLDILGCHMTPQIAAHVG